MRHEPTDYTLFFILVEGLPTEDTPKTSVVLLDQRAVSKMFHYALFKEKLKLSCLVKWDLLWEKSITARNIDPKNLKNFKLNPVTLYIIVTMFHIGEIHGVSHELQQKRAQCMLSSVK